MIAMNDEKFEDNKFAIQVIAKGAFIDSGSGGGKVFMLETTVVRMNHIALNAWLRSQMINCRECYEDGSDGAAEWEAHKAEKAAQCEAVRAQLIDDLGIDSNKGSVCITQSQSEVFTIVHTWDIGKESDDTQVNPA